MYTVIILLASLTGAGIVALVALRIIAKRPEEQEAISRFTPLEAEGYLLKRREVIPEGKGKVLLSEASRYELYSKVLSLSSSKFRSHASAIIYSRDGIDISVLGAGGNPRLEQLLKHFFRPFFVLGNQDSFGFQETANAEGSLQQFNSLGLRYVVSQPIREDDSNIVLWLGYRYPPEATLIGSFKSFVLELARELPSFRHYYGLSERIISAEKANKLKSEAIAHVSHDIRSPLNNIKSILSLLIREGVDNDLVEVALKNCDAVSEIVESMLDYSLHQAGKLSGKFEVLDIAAEVKDVAASYKIAAKMKGLAFKIQDAKSLHVKADKRHLRRIIGNLVSNAVKYTKHGEIEIGCHKVSDESVEILVKDTGVGMSESELTQLFVPFTRFEAKGVEGIGLGLALSQVLASINGGLLSVVSKSNEGSTFKLSLPLAEHIKAPIVGIKEANTRSISGLKRRNIKILLVDDDKDCVFTLARSIKGEGIDVLTSVTVSDAISIINFEKPDLVITDASMPDGGGIRLLKFITKTDPNLPVAVVSGRGEGDIKGQFLGLSISKIFVKPIDTLELLEWIKVAHSASCQDRALVA